MRPEEIKSKLRKDPDFAMKQQSFAELVRLRKEQQAAKKREQRAQALVKDQDSSSTRLEGLALKESLRPYQQASVLQALSNFKAKRPTMDASSMGLGKTRMAASFLLTTKQHRTLWLTAKSPLVAETAKELNKLGILTIPVEPKSFSQVAQSFDNQTQTHLTQTQPIVFITNYEALGNMKRPNPNEPSNPFLAYPFNCLVIDEVTKLKGGASYTPSQIWLKTKELIETKREQDPDFYTYFITGTPVENYPKEVWAYLHLFDPIRFPKLGDFEKAFCNPQVTGLKLNNDALYDLLRSYIIRNTYASTKTELPPVTNNWNDPYICPLEPNSDVHLLYTRLKTEFSMWLEEQPTKLNVTMILEHLLRMRQLLSSGTNFTFTKQYYNEQGLALSKFPETINLKGPFPKLDLIESKIFDQINDQEQVIVFSCFKESLQELKRRFSIFLDPTELAVIDGSSSKLAPTYVDQFQQGKIKLLLINKLSGAHGLNLQKCDQWPGGSSHIHHVDTWWNPAREDQANARIVRVNTNAPCFIHYYKVPNSVDVFMWELNDLKRSLQEDVDQTLIVDRSFIQDHLNL